LTQNGAGDTIADKVLIYFKPFNLTNMNKANRIGPFIFIAILMFLGQFTLEAQTKKQLTIIVKIAPEVVGKGTGILEMTKNGKEKSAINIPINERYTLNLDFFNEYNLKFKYPDHLDKTVLISTKVPNEIWQKDANFPSFPMIVNLIKNTKENVKREKEKPILKVAYMKEIDNFGKVLPNEK
jgi:hypothetical protein